MRHSTLRLLTTYPDNRLSIIARGGMAYSLCRTWPFFVMLGILLSTVLVNPADTPATDMQDEHSTYGILFGYGSSYPGWGSTKIRVETVDAVFRYKLPKSTTIGSSWYTGYHSLLVEVPVNFLVDRSGPPMIGCSFLAEYTFTGTDGLRPYVFAGGGPLYVPADIPGMGTHMNGHYQCGLGIRYPLEDRHALLFEVRYHHISNAGTADPNDPLNSLKFLIGYTF